MVPDTFVNFFVASATVSGALIGLLFVATAIAPERTVNENAPALTQQNSANAFILLSNTLFISLGALIPGFNAGNTAIIVSVVGVVGTLMFSILTWIHRAEGGVNWLWWLRRLLTLGLFAWQFMIGVHLLSSDNPTIALTNMALIVLIFYAIGLESAWELLGGRGHGVADAIRAVSKETKRSQLARDGDSAAAGREAQPDNSDPH